MQVGSRTKVVTFADVLDREVYVIGKLTRSSVTTGGKAKLAGDIWSAQRMYTIASGASTADVRTINSGWLEFRAPLELQWAGVPRAFTQLVTDMAWCFHLGPNRMRACLYSLGYDMRPYVANAGDLYGVWKME